MATNTFASESNHWYLPNGDPYYSLVGANGKERAVTLRDARKVGAYPSVTTVIRLAASPGLQQWLIKTAIESALTLPRVEGETSDAFLVRVEDDRKAQAKAAADRGTEIHAAIEKHYRNDLGESSWSPWVVEAVGEINKVCGKQVWKPERSFADPRGYGGKTDLHSGEWVLDFKSIDKDVPKALYDEHICQLAAYREGLHIPGARAGILYVQRERPAATLIEAAPLDLDKGWEMFSALLSYHQAKNRYRPGDQK
jgi:hypothetical protein